MFNDTDNYAYGECIWVKRGSRGLNIVSKMYRASCFYLYETENITGFISMLTNCYALKSLSQYGFNVFHTVYYDEFEYNGDKIYGDMKSNKHYLNGRPGAYF